MEARIAVKAVPLGAHLQEEQLELPDRVGPFEPGERLVLLSETRVEQGHVVWPIGGPWGLLLLELEQLRPPSGMTRSRGWPSTSCMVRKWTPSASSTE